MAVTVNRPRNACVLASAWCACCCYGKGRGGGDNGQRGRCTHNRLLSTAWRRGWPRRSGVRPVTNCDGPLGYIGPYCHVFAVDLDSFLKFRAAALRTSPCNQLRTLNSLVPAATPSEAEQTNVKPASRTCRLGAPAVKLRIFPHALLACQFRFSARHAPALRQPAAHIGAPTPPSRNSGLNWFGCSRTSSSGWWPWETDARCHLQ